MACYTCEENLSLQYLFWENEPTISIAMATPGGHAVN